MTDASDRSQAAYSGPRDEQEKAEAEKTDKYLEYIQRTAKIRALSSPSLSDMDSAEDYATKLRENFVMIGELAALNRALLDAELYPVIESDEPLGEKAVREIKSFGESLADARSAESLDLPIMLALSERLLSEADESGDILRIIRQMDARIGTLYGLMNMTHRLKEYPEISEHYRKLGFSVGRFFFNLLQKKHFEKISDMECRKIVLTDARYSIVFFEGITGDRGMCEEELEKLAYMLAAEKDPFYREALPDYDWRYFRFRVLQYYSLAPEHNNAAGFTEEELERIFEKTGELCRYYDENEEYFRSTLKGLENRTALDVSLWRNGYLAGKISGEEYRRILENTYNDRKNDDYTTGGGYLNLFVPEEMIRMIGTGRCGARDQQLLQKIYRNLISYAFHIPNGESVSVLLEPYADCLNGFIEKPGCISFEDMVLQCLAAFHPPTYVHSLTVAQITECLCGHLIATRPELLAGVLECGDREAVREKKDEIIRLAYHAALCHDFGKIMIIDTIFVYGRKLLDMEFELIRTHPKTGSGMLKRHASTKAYADVALGHHKWYDNSRGYPEDFDPSGSPLKPIIDIVHAADCLDAATDSVGRSYREGKTLDEYLAELREGAGTRYAPWLCELTAMPEVRADLEYLLSGGRQNNYRNTYYLLREMQMRSR